MTDELASQYNMSGRRSGDGKTAFGRHNSLVVIIHGKLCDDFFIFQYITLDAFFFRRRASEWAARYPGRRAASHCKLVEASAAPRSTSQ